MAQLSYIPLENRAILTVEGEDAAHFLQGLITNDIKKVTESNSIYACMLTPQGKYLYDFFITFWQGKYFLDAGTTQPEALLRKLTMYKLRSKVEIRLATAEYSVFALTGEGVLPQLSLDIAPGKMVSDEHALWYTDPRTPHLGARAVIRSNAVGSWCSTRGLLKGSYLDYEVLRIALGIPDGVRDLIAEKSFPLQFGLDALHAIDFNKGCYVGQEVTARTKHRGVVRKGIFKVSATMPLPEYGTVITANGSTLGTLLSSAGNTGLALLRLDDWEKTGRRKTALAGEVIVALRGALAPKQSSPD